MLESVKALNSPRSFSLLLILMVPDPTAVAVPKLVSFPSVPSEYPLTPTFHSLFMRFFPPEKETRISLFNFREY